MSRRAILSLLLLLVVLALSVAALAQRTKDQKADAVPPLPEVLYDLDLLPERVAEMRQAILEAARSGELDAMVPVLQSNELMPLLAERRVEDPVAFFKESSADGSGRDILAAMIDILEAGYVKTEVAGTETYIWPYFAVYPIPALTPAQEVELYRIASPAEVAAMKAARRYLHYSIGIGPEGTWHYFVKEK